MNILIYIKSKRVSKIRVGHHYDSNILRVIQGIKLLCLFNLMQKRMLGHLLNIIIHIHQRKLGYGLMFDLFLMLITAEWRSYHFIMVWGFYDRIPYYIYLKEFHWVLDRVVFILEQGIKLLVHSGRTERIANHRWRGNRRVFENSWRLFWGMILTRELRVVVVFSDVKLGRYCVSANSLTYKRCWRAWWFPEATGILNFTDHRIGRGASLLVPHGALSSGFLLPFDGWISSIVIRSHFHHSKWHLALLSINFIVLHLHMPYEVLPRLQFLL